MSTAYQSAESEPDINDPVIETGDLSGETSDVVPKSSKVAFVIKGAKVRTQLEDNKKGEADDNKWKARWLSLQLQISDAGIDPDDEDAPFAGRTLFQDLCIQVNKADFPKLAESTYYSRAPYTQLLRALGYDLTQPPVINAEFRESLVDREVIADIQVRAIQDKVGDDWVDTGDTKNVVKNFRAA